jgi:hypothetical protein
MSEKTISETVAEKLSKITENTMCMYETFLEAGKKAEYDRFWDEFQNYGNRTNYAYAFKKWTTEIFKPKYNITAKGSNGALFQEAKLPDLKGILESLGVKLDTSESAYLLQFFQGATIQYIPEIDARKVTNSGYAFSSSAIISIDKLIVSETTTWGSTTFNGASSLESVIFEGTIGKDGLILSSCTKLNHDSLMSIINCLKDYSGSGSTYTVTLGTTNLAKLTDAEKAIATEKGWTLA